MLPSHVISESFESFSKPTGSPSDLRRLQKRWEPRETCSSSRICCFNFRRASSGFFLLHEQVHSQRNGHRASTVSVAVAGNQRFPTKFWNRVFQLQVYHHSWREPRSHKVRLWPHVFTLNSGLSLLYPSVAFPNAIPSLPTAQGNVFLSPTGVGLEMIWMWEEPAAAFFGGGETWQ